MRLLGAKPARSFIERRVVLASLVLLMLFSPGFSAEPQHRLIYDQKGNLIATIPISPTEREKIKREILRFEDLGVDMLQHLGCTDFAEKGMAAIIRHLRKSEGFAVLTSAEQLRALAGRIRIRNYTLPDTKQGKSKKSRYEKEADAYSLAIKELSELIRVQIFRSYQLSPKMAADLLASKKSKGQYVRTRIEEVLKKIQKLGGGEHLDVGCRLGGEPAHSKKNIMRYLSDDKDASGNRKLVSLADWVKKRAIAAKEKEKAKPVADLPPLVVEPTYHPPKVTPLTVAPETPAVIIAEERADKAKGRVETTTEVTPPPVETEPKVETRPAVKLSPGELVSDSDREREALREELRRQGKDPDRDPPKVTPLTEEPPKPVDPPKKTPAPAVKHNTQEDTPMPKPGTSPKRDPKKKPEPTTPPRKDPPPKPAAEPPVKDPTQGSTSTAYKTSDVTHVRYVDARYLNKEYAARPKSVLKGKAQFMIDVAVKNGIDPVFFIAAINFETGWGTSDKIRNRNNPGGLTGSSGRYSGFKTLNEGIESMGKYLKARYVDRGLSTVASIAKVYAPVGAKNDPNGTNYLWPGTVADIMNKIIRNSLKLKGQ